MSFLTTAAVVGTVTAVAGTAYMLSGAGNPDQPDLAASSAELANANAQLLPIRRALEAAAQQGKSVTVTVPEHFDEVESAWVPNPPSMWQMSGRTPTNTGQWVPYKSEEWAAGGKYNADGKTAAPKTKVKRIKIPEGPETFDFTGYGEAEVKGKLADAMAKVQLGLSQKYDSQFIEQALEQQKLADPESFAARSRMNDLIQEQIGRPLNVPVADELNRQVQAELSAAGSGRLDPAMERLLMQGAGAAQGARGGASSTNPADFAQPLTTGFAGTERKLGAIGKATGELAGGQTPEDIAYRREQQDLANLASFVAGKTPQSQFSSLSGAQTGPTPFSPGQTLPVMPGNSAGAQGAAINAWNTQMDAQANQTSPWIAGLTSLLGVGKTAANLGWQPLAK